MTDRDIGVPRYSAPNMVFNQYGVVVAKGPDQGRAEIVLSGFLAILSKFFSSVFWENG